MSINTIRESVATKVATVSLGLVVALSMVMGGVVLPAQAQTQEEQIASLLAMIQSLTAQLNALQGGASVAPTSSVSYTFTKNLEMGDDNADVMNLQKVLNMSADTQVAASGVGSAGNETSYFGGLTKAAVIKFQDKYASEVLAPVGLSKGTGYVGPSTRAKLNTMTAPVVVVPTTPTTPTTPVVSVGTGLTVSSASQPSASLAVESAARVPFTKLTLTAGADGDVTVNSVTVERTGLAADAAFAGVVLLDEDGTQLGISKTLNSNHQTTVGDPFVVKAGTSKTVTIAANMGSNLDSYAGQVASLSVVAVNTSATVSGALPITGAAHTVNASLAIGSVTATRGVLDPNTSASKEIGTTGYTFAAIKLTAGSAEDVRVHSVRFNQSGSVSASDLENVKIMLDGVAYEPTLSSDGQYYSVNFGSGVVIAKGLNKEVSIKGDVVDGSGRSVIFDVYKDTDIYVTGETYGYGITPSATAGSASDSNSDFTSGTPWFDGSKVTVDAGSISSVSKAASVPAQNISVLTSNQPLGGFEVEVKGEPISIQQMVFNVMATGDEAENITNVSLVDQNGSVVAGPVDGVSNSTNSADGKFTFTDTVTLPVGKTTLALKGQLGSAFATNDTVVASTTPSSDWTNVTGQTTGNTISLSSNGEVTGNTMTVKAGDINVTVSPTPTTQTVVKGQSGFTFANVQMDATASGEDVRFTSLPLAYVATGSGNDVTNCFVYDGSTKLNNTAVNPTADGTQTYTLDSYLVVPKGTVKTVAVKCDIPSSLSASDTFKWGIPASAISGTGLGSGQTVSDTPASASYAGVMTLADAGSLTVTSDASTPSYTLASAGSTGVTLGVLKFHATNEDINLERVALQLTNTASSSASDLTQVTLWDGSTQVGTALFTGSNTNATSTFTSTVTVPKDSDKLITIKGDLAQIGTSLSGTEGALVAVDYDGGDSEGTRGVGTASGTTINQGSSTDTSFEGVRMFKSYPTVAKLAVPTQTLSNGSASLLRFKVTADAAGDVSVRKFAFSVSTTSATSTSMNVYAYTDSGFSTPVSGLTTTDGSLLTSSVDGNTIDATVTAASAGYVQIPAGQSRYFEVRGTISNATTGSSISTQLEGDATYPSFATALMGTASEVASSDFVWSPNATTTSTTSHVDWTNGYGVSGLPGTNLTAEVLSR